MEAAYYAMCQRLHVIGQYSHEEEMSCLDSGVWGTTQQQPTTRDLVPVPRVQTMCCGILFVATLETNAAAYMPLYFNMLGNCYTMIPMTIRIFLI